MGVNKVVVNKSNGEETLIDLTMDTVTPETLLKGYIAHDNKGEPITGIYEGAGAAILIKEATPTRDSLTIQFAGLAAEPSAFSVQVNKNITLASTRYVVDVNYDGTETEGVCGYTSGSSYSKTGTIAYSASAFTWTYSNGTITVTSSGASDGGYFKANTIYKLIYVANAETADGGTTEIKLQEKTATPTEAAQTIKPDSGYDGLSQVSISAIQTETKTVTENGTVTPTEGKYLKSVVVNVTTGGGDGLPDVIVAGDTPILASWGGSVISNADAYTESGLEVTVPKDGTYRFYFTATKGSSMTGGGNTNNPTVRLYKNDVAVGSVISVSQTAPSTPYSADVACSAGDVIKVYGKANKASYSTYSIAVSTLIACIDK
jgi:hypothetical protein